ncbi:MAG: hypothetical protein LQ346_001324 [Caloplaca aetnensis]|nr:MAG: hypothetical protein LQ346_001324 [Caloplaca aetnensis]
MPQSPNTPGRRRDPASSASNSKIVDVGNPLGTYDTSTVRDRVRQWQAQGGGVVNAPDVYIEHGQEEQGRNLNAAKPASSSDKHARTPTATQQTSPEAQSSGTPRSRKGRPSKRTSGDEDKRDRSKSAPAKRVISDAHWRKDRSTPKDKASPRTVTGTTPKMAKYTDNDGIRVRPMPTEREARLARNHDISEETNKNERRRAIKKETPEPRRSYSKRSPSPTSSTHSHDAKGNESPIPHETHTQNVNGCAARQTRPTIARSPQRGPLSKTTRARKDASMAQADSRSEQESASGYGSISGRKESRKSQKGNILSQVFEESRKAFAKPQPIPIETPRVPSVEAWLNTTPDPFVDGERPLGEEAVSFVDRRGTPSPPPEPVAVEDPNKIWDTLHTKDAARSGVRASRRRKRIPSSTIYTDNPFPSGFESGSPLNANPTGSTSASKLVDLVDEPCQSPSTLTRRRARRSVLSPKRSSNLVPPREDQHNGDGASALSSSPTVSTVEEPESTTSLRPPGLRSRPFPSTGKHRLSTIASVDTLHSKLQMSETMTTSKPLGADLQPKLEDAEVREVESGDQFDPDSLKPTSSRLAKHADLMSVLSMPEPGNKSIRSARSIRTNRSRLATATVADLMGELANDESKFIRELRTLVDGVIPVLLTCVLSKSDSAVAAGLFHPNCNGHEDPNFTKPIIDMGIALERLKSLHRRIPTQDAKSLLTWAQGAQRVYTEYLKAWRMGFQDVVVNLAPANDSQTAQRDGSASGLGGIEEGLPVNQDGDVVDGDGERVDVAFLLKRPLVRLKYLAKTLKGINIVAPSAEAESLATKYQQLVTMARNRSNEERARLEDEAAANIDTTRARDPRTLAPTTGVSIDRTRRVRARDHFNLALQHSSGQRIDCRVELLLRDEASETAGSGDVLICEVDGTGRWLLFPPVQFGRVSARNGDHQGEIVVMVRGLSSTGVEWHELLSLKTEDEQSGFEWVQMLGLTPVPPTIRRTQSFLTKHRRKESAPGCASTLEAPTTASPAKSRTPSPREIEVPIGEQAQPAPAISNEKKADGPEATPLHLEANETSRRLQRKSRDLTSDNIVRSPHTYVDNVNDLRSLPTQAAEKAAREQQPLPRPRSFKEALGLSGTSNTSLGLKRTRAQKLPGHHGSPKSPRSPKASRSDLRESLEESGSEPRTANGAKSSAEERAGSDRKAAVEGGKASRPDYHRSLSSVPSADLPIIPKIRKDSPPTTPIDEPEEEAQWHSPPASKLPPASPKKSEKRVDGSSPKADVAAPATPPHQTPKAPDLKGSKTPVLSAGSARAARRRSSSPLKHEYEPSTASDSSDSDASTVERNEVSSVSSSDDEELEVGDVPTPLLPLGAASRVPKASAPGSTYSLPSGTLRPSESASQAPYKQVPAQPTKASKTIASIFCWSDKGSWESLHPDECSIIITPGLIEAYKMSAAHSAAVPLSAPGPVEDVEAFSEIASVITGPDEVIKSGRPLVALELTPLVPLRRGTAIDISIRSPPTANSQITSGNNIMFRSRNPEECEALYALINHARIHNPTYIALQNARGPFDTAHAFDRQASTRAGSRASSWFGGIGRSSSYRASSAPTPSIAPSESSIGSMSSAFSALKRFGIGKSGGMFNIARSTISSREGSRANSIYTSSDNSSGSGASSPLPPGVQGDPQGQMGLSNTKIRLYFRETQTRWRDMGSARLTIMRPSVATDLSSGRSASSGELLTRPSTSRGQGTNEKRIVVCGKTKGEVLLDATLGETCFERVGRQGIAVSVWEDIIGPNGELGTVGAVGGVGAGRAKVYMIQMKGEAETTYTFSIVGRLRY